MCILQVFTSRLAVLNCPFHAKKEYLPFMPEHPCVRCGAQSEQEQIEELVRAASEAPSWNNFQTSRYHVVMSDEMKQSVKLWKILPNSTKASSKD